MDTKLQENLKPVTDTRVAMTNLLRVIGEFNTDPKADVLKDVVFPEGSDIENWKVGLGSDATKEKAKLLILTSLLRMLLNKSNELKSLTENKTSLVIKDYLVSPSLDLAKFINFSNQLDKYNAKLTEAAESEEKMRAIESVAISIIEPFLRNITNYMQVKEYLFRLNNAVNELKSMDSLITVESLVKAYQVKLNLLKENLDSPLDEQYIPGDIKDWNKLVDSTKDAQDFLITFMKVKEVNNDDVELTTIFKLVRSIASNLFIVADTYKRIVDNIIQFKGEDASTSGLNLYALTVGDKLSLLLNGDNANALIELLANKEEFDKTITVWSTNLSVLYNLDIDFYVKIYNEAKGLRLTGSVLYIVSSLLDNILNKA